MSKYNQAIAAIKGALSFGIDPTLRTISALVKCLGNPQQNYQCIQIAGTNGKTSTSRFTAAFLRSHGAKVALYTSPNLIEYPERMEIDGQVVSNEDFATAILAAKDCADVAIKDGNFEHVTEFELITAAALWLYAERHVEFAVLEVGMGGSWDATSVVTPKVAVITGINLDHTHVLGDTVEAIAREKAAIIKAESIGVLGEGTKNVRETFFEQAKKVGAPEPIIAEQHAMLDELDISRFPSYQRHNIICALIATEKALGRALDLTSIQDALRDIQIPGRFELINKDPKVLIDAAHNPESAQTLATSLKERYGIDKDSGYIEGFDTLLLGVLEDKDAKGIIPALIPLFKNIAVTQSSSPRAIDANDLAHIVKKLDKESRTPQVFGSVKSAVETFLENGNAVVATGSITLAGEVKAIYGKANNDKFVQGC